MYTKTSRNTNFTALHESLDAVFSHQKWMTFDVLNDDVDGNPKPFSRKFYKIHGMVQYDNFERYLCFSVLQVTTETNKWDKSCTKSPIAFVQYVNFPLPFFVIWASNVYKTVPNSLATEHRQYVRERQSLKLTCFRCHKTYIPI